MRERFEIPQNNPEFKLDSKNNIPLSELNQLLTTHPDDIDPKVGGKVVNALDRFLQTVHAAQPELGLLVNDNLQPYDEKSDPPPNMTANAVALILSINLEEFKSVFSRPPTFGPKNWSQAQAAIRILGRDHDIFVLYLWTPTSTSSSCMS